MRRCLLIIALALICGCRQESSTPAAPAAVPQENWAPRDPRMDDFFVKWFEGHGHEDVVVDADGVGVRDNAARLRASLYGSKRHGPGGVVVEVEFTVRLPSGGQITEFVAGMGETEERAVNDALLNFTLTTFHVVYKAFVNADDPHMTSATVPIGGADREVIAGDIFMRGSPSDEEIDLHAMNAQIQGALKAVPLAPGPHWVKVVYSQDGGVPTAVAVTLDNAAHPGLTDAVKRLKWPPREGVYMAKQFIVVK